ncbi:glycosyltransferase [Flavobacterium sp. NG2]|uniref:glycosyltransferase n=1 Tax=Flavobacterium sp. NG2 TaxID=3097547 RepID=UPI002A8174CA|nr:glycosyltransferase [Flavobacterium sp. NG2]WPR72043.1 glycosyltransferase [Flavobacterium sp. NG2]
MSTKSYSKKILITPLNWGLGHATRCIPIIKVLQNFNYNLIIASDGDALNMLKKEFPNIKSLELPSYKIQYPKKGKYFKWKLLLSLPKITKAILKEQKIITKWIEQYNIDGIISDNRLGCYSSKVPSVYLTHQVNVLTGKTTWLSSFIHQYFIKKYRECWIPDNLNEPNLAGRLSHSSNKKLTLKHIGPISRFIKKMEPKQFDLMIILSGPEPQRGILDNLLQNEIKRYKGKILYIKGIIEKEQKKEEYENVTFYNFMSSEQIEKSINESESVLCRSGYTSIMDLTKLEKKAFFIPTPGQYEQEYLASKLEQEGVAPFAYQVDFRIEDLEKIPQYTGLKNTKTTVEWEELLKIFK